MQKDKRYKVLNILFCIVAGVMLAGALAFFIVASVKNNYSLYIGSCILCGIEFVLTVAYIIYVKVIWRR